MRGFKHTLLILLVLLVSVIAYAVVVIDEDYVFNETVKITDLTASQPVVSDASKILVSTPYNTFAGNIDHGLLLGLSDDDHTQYHTDARALTWLGTRSTSDLPEGTNLYFTDEKAQDAIGLMVDGTLIYTDGTPLLSRAAISGDGFIPVGANTLTLSTVNSNVGTFGDSANIPQLTVNGKGLVTAISNVSITIPTQYTDEMAQDAVGGILADTSDIHLDYNDTTPSISGTLTTTGVTAATYGSVSSVGTFAVDSRGRITSALDAAIAISSAAISDFTEAAQDAVGAMVDSSLIYTDLTPLLSRAALTGDVTASQGSNTTTLATVNSNVGSFGSATQVGTFTVNGKGLITAASNTTVTPAVGSITGLGTGVATWLATPSSANLRSAVTDETGSGALVFATGGTLNQAIANTLTVTNLTSGRVPFATTGGQLTDDADMTFATDTLTAANVVGSSEVRIGNGLVNNPSLAFDSDTDTGIYRVSANILGVTTATVQSAQFEELAVSSGSAQGWRLRNVTPTATIPSLVPNQSDTNTGVGWDSADELSLVAGGTQAANFGSTFSWIGNTLGVGTTTPSATLDVNGASIFRGTLSVNAGASATAVQVGADTGTYSALQFNGANNTAKDFIFNTASSPRWTLRVSGNETGSNAASNLSFIPFDDAGSGLNTALFLNRASGNISIGGVNASFGTGAVKVLAITNGTAPSTSPSDGVQLWAQDTVAGQSNLYARNENGKSIQITGLADRVSSQFNKANTTLADITGLSHNVEAGKAYKFEGIFYTTSNVASGIKFAIAGTATATSVIYESQALQTGTSVATTASRSAALAGTVCNVTAVTVATCIIRGTILVNAAGTLVPQFADNAGTNTSSVLVGSTWILTPIGD